MKFADLKKKMHRVVIDSVRRKFKGEPGIANGYNIILSMSKPNIFMKFVEINDKLMVSIYRKDFINFKASSKFLGKYDAEKLINRKSAESAKFLDRFNMYFVDRVKSRRTSRRSRRTRRSRRSSRRSRRTRRSRRSSRRSRRSRRKSFGTNLNAAVIDNLLS